MTGQRLGRLHVAGVDVRPLLAVDLDGHEVTVEIGRGRLVLERLVRHHVAPVTRGIADADEHRHVTPRRLGEGLVAPLPPVDRIVLVLQQIGARTASEPVRHLQSPPP